MLMHLLLGRGIQACGRFGDATLLSSTVVCMTKLSWQRGTASAEARVAPKFVHCGRAYLLSFRIIDNFILF